MVSRARAVFIPLLSLARRELQRNAREKARLLVVVAILVLGRERVRGVLGVFLAPERARERRTHERAQHRVYGRDIASGLTVSRPRARRAFSRVHSRR